MSASDEVGGQVNCSKIEAYVKAFLEQGPIASNDMGGIGEHAAHCPSCYARLSSFFKNVELPESRYFAETIDELAFSLYNLARAIIRERPRDESDGEAYVIELTEEGGGSAAENLESGVEMLDDVEDYAGSSFVQGMNVNDLRELLENAEKGEVLRVDLAIQVFQRITEIKCRYVAPAWNWIGALNYQQQRFDEAEGALRAMLECKDGAQESRAYAHCTLSYIHKQRGDLEEAIRSARRSSVLAEEDDRDPYFGQFAEFYFRLLRGEEDDLAAARELLLGMTGDPSARSRLRSDLLARQNRPVLEALRSSPLADSFPVDPAEDGPAGGARVPN